MSDQEYQALKAAQQSLKAEDSFVPIGLRPDFLTIFPLAGLIEEPANQQELELQCPG
jgi:hypothetical protein